MELDPEIECETLTSESNTQKNRYVTGLVDNIAQYIGKDAPVLKKDDVGLVINTWVVKALYQIVVLVFAWIGYRHSLVSLSDDDDEGLSAAATGSIVTGSISAVLVAILCAIKTRPKIREGFLILFAIVFGIFLILTTEATHSDTIPRLLFTSTTVAFIILISGIMAVPSGGGKHSSLCLSSLTNLCLLWTIGLHTLLVAASPSVANRTSIEATVQDFTLALLVVCYQLLQLRFIPRFNENRQVSVVLVQFIIDIPLYVISSVLSFARCLCCSSSTGSSSENTR